jgi:choline dehydrogenase
VARLVADLEIPTLPEMNIPESDIPMLADLAFKDPQTVGNPRDLTLQSYVQIYESCF